MLLGLDDRPHFVGLCTPLIKIDSDISCIQRVSRNLHIHNYDMMLILSADTYRYTDRLAPMHWWWSIGDRRKDFCTGCIDP